MRHMPVPSVLHLGNSSTVRYAQLFPLPHGVQVECNRGINGIEGSLSTALGYAMGDERPQFIICGDLSFFYDMNALWQSGLLKNVRILLLNNGTGGIFKTLSTPKLDCVEGTHQATAEAWVKDRGFNYISVTNAQQWDEALRVLCNPQENAPIFVEAFTDAQNDADILKYFYKQH